MNVIPESSSSSSAHSHVTFEELLLSSMKQVTNRKTSKRKVTSGVSIITSEEAIEILRAKDNEKKNQKKRKNVWPIQILRTLVKIQKEL